MALLREIYVLFFILSLSKTIFCEERVVSSPVGNIKGVTDTLSFNGKDYTYTKFLGIPFAESAGGERRFKRPIKKEPFTETYDATEERFACVQNPEWDPNPPASGEDCLNMNIFVPDTAVPSNPKPVMMFIYGGGFQQGYQNSYGVGALPVLNDVVYVTINYRVTIFGFLFHSKYGLEGNYGLWDQHMAIQWVQDNIAAFGGDPNHVTIFGESAGGASVTYQALYEENIGLFQGFIAESGVTGSPWSYTDVESAEKLTEQIIQYTGCDSESVEVTLQCLRMTSIDDITGVINGTSFLPVHDGDFIKYHPAKLYDTSVESSRNALLTFSNFNAIIGVNSDESIMEIYYAFSMGLFGAGEIINYPDDLTPELAMSFLEYNLNYPDDALMKSMLHQYTDWNDPNNPNSLNEQLGDLMSDYTFITPAIWALQAHAQIENGKGTYMYFFEHRPSYSMLPDFVNGASHTDEIPFVLGFPTSYLTALGVTMNNVSDSEIALSTTMMTYWSQFARSGNPNTDPAMATWPMYDANSEKYLVFNTAETPLPTRQYLQRRQVSYWTNVYPKLTEAIKKADMYPGICDTSSTTNVFPSVCLLVYLLTVILMLI